MRDPIEQQMADHQSADHTDERLRGRIRSVAHRADASANGAAEWQRIESVRLECWMRVVHNCVLFGRIARSSEARQATEVFGLMNSPRDKSFGAISECRYCLVRGQRIFLEGVCR